LKKNVIENKNIIDFFEYSFKNMEIRVPYRDILYIETTGVSHKLRLVGKNFQKEFFSKERVNLNPSLLEFQEV